jgi:hypothetical protein
MITKLRDTYLPGNNIRYFCFLSSLPPELSVIVFRYNMFTTDGDNQEKVTGVSMRV